MVHRAGWAIVASIAVVVMASLVGCQAPSASCDPIVYGDLPCL